MSKKKTRSSGKGSQESSSKKKMPIYASMEEAPKEELNNENQEKV